MLWIGIEGSEITCHIECGVSFIAEKMRTSSSGWPSTRQRQITWRSAGIGRRLSRVKSWPSTTSSGRLWLASSSRTMRKRPSATPGWIRTSKILRSSARRCSRSE